MSESDYQRGLRGGNFNSIIASDPQAWQDWQDGHNACQANEDAREREQEAQDAALIAASQPGFYSFSTLVSTIKSSGYKINKSYSDSLSYYITVDGITRKIIAYDSDEYVRFYTRTRFQFNTEAEFSRDLLNKALRASYNWYETYFTIFNETVTNTQGSDEQKWILNVFNDKWKGIMIDDWLPNIHTALFGLSADIENK